MTRIYEIMFLIDNNAVRAGWKEAKAAATGLVEKHSGRVLAARRWDERKLAYSIKRRRRGTYLLAYAELAGSNVTTLRRELDLSESVLRYLILQVESVPPNEIELTQTESAAGFLVPEPPPEDVVDNEQRAVEEEEDDKSEFDVGIPELAEEEV